MFLRYLFLYIASSLYSETLELSSPTESNRTKSNRIKHGFAGSELFRCFFEFGSIEPNSVLLHLNDFYEFGSIELEKTSKY